MSDKTLRPDFDVIQQWTEKRDEMRDFVVSLGLTCAELEHGYSVTRQGRQVAVFDLSEGGDFRWGWVEHRSQQGRTDYTSQSTWAQALSHVHTQRKAVSV